MLKIILGAIIMAIFALADGPVLQTGQVKSYDIYGNIVTDGSIKDDGFYRIGAVRSYDLSADVVIDNATGLKWQDNEAIEKPWLTQENYLAGNDYNTSGDTADTYCNTLTFNGGNWRVPTMEELQTLTDYSQFNPAATIDIFNILSSDHYWSSTTSVVYTDTAWVKNFNDGSSNYNEKNSNFYVRCVQGEPLEPSNLSRDCHTEIVTDNTTGLQWQDNNTTFVSTYLKWIDAINYCENTLDLGGHSDWRLPNLNELLSTVEYDRQRPAMDPTFQYARTPAYWSSTTRLEYTYNAWSVEFYSGKVDTERKTGYRYVRCVRGCPKGQHYKHGEKICVPGTPVFDPGIQLPECEDDERLSQGTDDCNIADKVSYTDLWLPSCPVRQQHKQGTGTSSCTDTPNRTPVAKVEGQCDISIGATVTLDGSASSDPDRDTLTYQWTMTDKPAGSTAALSGTIAQKPTLTVDKGGNYTIELLVNDGDLDSDPVIITVMTCKAITHNGTEYCKVVSPLTGKIWLDRNLGAERVCTALNDPDCYGDHYQWGRNFDGHQESGSDTTDTQSGDVDDAGSQFIIENPDWASVDGNGTQRSINWSATYGSSVCPVNFRLPTWDELNTERQSWESQNSAGAFGSALKFPSAGHRNYLGGTLNQEGSGGVLWSSSSSESNNSKAFGLGFDANSVDWYNGADERASGRSVRCIKE